MKEKSGPHPNTNLIYAASMAVSAGFTAKGLSAGITFIGPPCSEPALFKLAHADGRATPHRISPEDNASSRSVG